jgi:hypothetical protein
VIAWALRRHARDRRALFVAVAAAGATLVTLLSTWKLGTSLNSVVPVEATLVPLALAGCVYAARQTSERGLAALGRGGAALAAVAVTFAVVQGIALVAHKDIRGAHPFLRPGSSPGYGITLPTGEVDAAVRAARSCPDGVPYSGTPFIAFNARRPLPGNQPDQYLAQLAPVLKDAADAIHAAKTVCPQQAPATHGGGVAPSR